LTIAEYNRNSTVSPVTGRDTGAYYNTDLHKLHLVPVVLKSAHSANSAYCGCGRRSTVIDRCAH